MVTSRAQRVLANHYVGKKIFSVNEELTHDGYDNEGHQSNIWILTIVTREAADEEDMWRVFTDVWTYEQWYTPGERLEYDLCQKK